MLKFNLLYTESYYKYVNFLGGSKPPPYRVGQKSNSRTTARGRKYNVKLIKRAECLNSALSLYIHLLLNNSNSDNIIKGFDSFYRINGNLGVGVKHCVGKFAS